MNQKKNIFLSSIVIAIIAVIAVSIILIMNHKPLGLSEEGTPYDTISDFNAAADKEHTSPLSQAFLSEIAHEIIEIGKDEMTVSVVNCYKAELLNHPKFISHTYGTKTVDIDTEYTVYDIDKDGIFELIVKEDNNTYFVYTYDEGECKQCGKFDWNYADCLYEYDGNGLVVYDGGMGNLHLEYICLYSLNNGALTLTDTIISSEEHSLEKVRGSLESYTAIHDFYPIDDPTLLIP